MHYKDVVCKCKNVTVDDIKNAVDNGATTFDEVKEATKASTSCGICRNIIKELVDDLLK